MESIDLAYAAWKMALREYERAHNAGTDCHGYYNEAETQLRRCRASDTANEIEQAESNLSQAADALAAATEAAKQAYEAQLAARNALGAEVSATIEALRAEYDDNPDAMMEVAFLRQQYGTFLS